MLDRIGGIRASVGRAGRLAQSKGHADQVIERRCQHLSGSKPATCLALPLRLASSPVTRRRAGISRPPIGAVWGWAQTVAGRTATGSLLPGGALVLSPHQDDETIGCGLLMAEKANRGIPIAVAVATDGRAGWFSPMPRPGPNDIAEIRHREWHRALDALGVPRADRFELGFPDGELSDHEDELTERIGDLFRSVRPSQVFVTSSGDPHPDHRTLARAAGRAASQIYDSDPGAPADADSSNVQFSERGPSSSRIASIPEKGCGLRAARPG